MRTGCTAVLSVPMGGIVSTAEDHTLRLWQVADGCLRQVLIGHTDIVTAYAFSPDGQLIASVSTDTRLKVWDLSSLSHSQTSTGCCVANFPLETILYDCAWSPDGQHLAAVGRGGVYVFRFIGC